MADLPVLPPLPEPIVIKIEDITTGTLDGTGSFDKFMQVTRVHLLEEYTKQRITAADYTAVYTATINAAMDKAIAFTLTKDKTALELGILQIEYQKAVLNRDLVLAQIAKLHSDIEGNRQQISLSKAQEENVITENDNIKKQGTKLDKDILLTNAQILKITEETDNLSNNNGFR